MKRSKYTKREKRLTNGRWRDYEHLSAVEVRKLDSGYMPVCDRQGRVVRWVKVAR